MTKKLACACAVARLQADAEVRRFDQIDTKTVAMAAIAEIIDISNSPYNRVLGL